MRINMRWTVHIKAIRTAQSNHRPEKQLDNSTISTLRDKPLFPAVVRSFVRLTLIDVRLCRVVSVCELAHARNDDLLGHLTPAPPPSLSPRSYWPQTESINSLCRRDASDTSNVRTQPPTPARPHGSVAAYLVNYNKAVECMNAVPLVQLSVWIILHAYYSS